MKCAFFKITVVAAAIAFSPVVSFAQQAAPAAPAAPTAATADNAKAFLGDWAMTGESQMGPFAMDVSVKVDAGKVVGSVASEMQPLTPVTDVTKSGNSLILRYSFTFDGNAIPVVLTLTPKADKLDAAYSFADGAFEMAAVGTKKVAQ